MKTTSLLFVCLFTASIMLADDVKTLDGKEYKAVTVSRIEPDGITVVTDSGIEKILFINLPQDLQKKYGYNPVKQKEMIAAYSEAQKQRMLDNLRNHGLTTDSENDSGDIEIRRLPYKDLVDDEMTKARNLVLNQVDTQKLLSKIPPFGYIIFNIERPTMEEVESKHFTIIIFDRNGRELSRDTDDGRIELSGGKKRWTNHIVIAIPKNGDFPWRIRVVDGFRNKYYDFIAKVAEF